MVPLDPSRVRAIVFDVDGTLYPQRALRRAMFRLLAGAALASPGEGLTAFRALRAYRRAQEGLRHRAFETDLAETQLDWACRSTGLARPVVAGVVATWMEAAPLPILARLVDPSLHRLLDAARGRGIRLGVVSDYPPRAKLEALGLARQFHVAVGAQDAEIQRLKPDPRGLLEALRRLGVEPAHSLYVGDRPEVDGRTADAAGVPCAIVGRRRASRAATWMAVADFSALHALLFLASSPAVP